MAATTVAPDPTPGRGYITTYEPYEMRCSCSCGWSRYVTTHTHGDRLLAEHTDAHELLRRKGVTS